MPGHGREFRVVASEYETEVRAPNPDDRWDQGESSVDVTFRAAAICHEDHAGGYMHHYVCCEAYPEENKMRIPWDFDGDAVGIVVSRYSDGSTFGRVSGKWEVEAVVPPGDLVRVADELEPSLRKKHNHYFGSLESVETHVLRLERHPEASV